MANVSFQEIGAVVATFHGGAGVTLGHVVKVSGDKTVGACSAGDAFCGVALSEGMLVAVQVSGFVTVPITGTVGLGNVALAADGSGGVKALAGGQVCTVVSVDGDCAVIQL